MAPYSSSSSLSADAPLFVPQASHIFPPPAVPLFMSYVPPPPDLLPPIGFPCPFMGPPPPPGFGSPFQVLPPPSGYTCPVQGSPPRPGFRSPFPCPPPPPGFRPVSSPPLWGFPQSGSVGPPPPMRHDMMVLPPAPAGVRHATQPLQAHITAALKDGDQAPAGFGRTWRAASGRWRPKPLPPRRQRVAAKLAPIIGTVAIGIEGHGAAKGDPTNVSSPCSVLAAATTSPPGSPSVLPAALPYPAPTPSSPPASLGHARITKLSCRSVLPKRRQPLPPKQDSSPGLRRGCQRPRRLFNPACSLTTLMIRNIPNGFTRQQVMDILDQHCAEENKKIALGGGGVKSEYDFLYVPIDFRSTANKGYCFVNFTSPDAAFRLWKWLHFFRWEVNGSRKLCEIDYATIQGREPLVARFSRSCFDCSTEEFLPVWFSPPRDGIQLAVVERHVVGRLGRRL